MNLSQCQEPITMSEALKEEGLESILEIMIMIMCHCQEKQKYSELEIW